MGRSACLKGHSSLCFDQRARDFHYEIQEQERLTLETELAKSKAKERVLSSVMEAAPRPFVPSPVNLESKKGEGKVQAPIIGLETKPVGANGHLSVVVGCSTLNPEAAEWHQPSLGMNRNERVNESEDSGASTSPSERAFHEMLGLHHRQNALQQQQNKIMEMLATQQKKSSLPQQRVPIFDGDPMDYGAFVKAFENLIESRTSSGTERLYYLALNWPEVRAEDSASLDKFSIFLMRCKNAMKCSKHRTKLEQPDTIQKLVLKLPFNLRTTWRRLADKVTETERRSVTFSDLAEFVDNEARVIANPVFGKITEDTKPKNERKDKQNRSGSGKTSLATQVGDLQSPPPRAPPSGSTPTTEDVLCSFRNSGHALDACEALRRLPEENVHLVKEKLPGFLAAVKRFKEAHLAYSSNLQDEASLARCQAQLKSESSRADLIYQRTQQWIKGSEELLRLNSQINPEDSASQIGSRATTKSSSKKSRRSSHSGSNRSRTSSLVFARAKEATRIAELEAEAVALEK
ncbi:hypothetical protein AWC38_SpisGene15035 [Stylophora pistillata]|uniref:Uncharacterized protein n=1 Tax=Stylophora pistillata TaxID=50429 RepID=A0A2B4RPZ1_STYPI|nr:hypothetical protein AWC38_SpisGene15035 [Stylophora pistillata]